MKEITVRLEPGLRATVETDDHRFIAGEPVALGGDNAGPDPYELLLASLGACAVLTMRLYADRKGWDLRSATVVLSHGRTHVRDCESCDEEAKGKGGYIDRIQKVVTLTGDLDDTQRSRLVDIAGRCPVERTLERGPVIETVAG